MCVCVDRGIQLSFIYRVNNCLFTIINVQGKKRVSVDINIKYGNKNPMILPYKNACLVIYL